MNTATDIIWDGSERRSNGCRRANRERRSQQERRFDKRSSTPEQRSFSLQAWIRSLLRSRIGVDRRKNTNQRQIRNRRRQTIRSILTKEEISELLQ